MRREIVINAGNHETRIAILEEKELVEVMVERPEARRRVGDIYKGRVNAVLPGMQAAFVDLGLEKTAFLHASDLHPSETELDDMFEDEDAAEDGAKDGKQNGGRGGGRWRRDEPAPKIEEALKKGQEILVQITKEPIGTKGPRVTTQISLPGRYLVLMPGHDHIGVSRKIEDRAERTRLKTLIKDIRPQGSGLIVRTVGSERGKKEFQADIKYLEQLWTKIEKQSQRAKAPAILHREMELTTGLIRDIFTEDVSQLVIDDKDGYKEVLDYLKNYVPELSSRVKLYRGAEPIFDHFGIEAELEKAMDRKVWLKRGGYITIDQTEALVAIDVNTGRFTGKKNQEDTILKTNVEAAEEIARQLRLRDLGGIVVLDFIDMESEGNKKAVLDTLRNRLKRDRSRTKAFAVSDLGLVEMTRQRQRPSLVSYFNQDCPECGGTGKVLSLASATLRIERMLRRVGLRAKEKLLLLRVHPDLAVHLVEQNADLLEDLERAYRFRIEIRDDPSLRRDEIRLFRGRTFEEITKQFER